MQHESLKMCYDKTNKYIHFQNSFHDFRKECQREFNLVNEPITIKFCFYSKEKNKTYSLLITNDDYYDKYKNKANYGLIILITDYNILQFSYFEQKFDDLKTSISEMKTLLNNNNQMLNQILKLFPKYKSKWKNNKEFYVQKSRRHPMYTLQLENNGETKWPRTIIEIESPIMISYSKDICSLEPNQSDDIVINFKLTEEFLARNTPGKYSVTMKLKNKDDNTYFGDSMILPYLFLLVNMSNESLINYHTLYPGLSNDSIQSMKNIQEYGSLIRNMNDSLFDD